MNSVESGFVDDAFLKEAFELLVECKWFYSAEQSKRERLFPIIEGVLTFLMVRRDRLVSMMVWRSMVLVAEECAE